MSQQVVGAVDIGGTKIAIGIVDDAGRVCAREEFPTAPEDGFDAAMTQIAQRLTRTRRALNVDLVGIGIGCTGPVDPVSGTIGNVDFLPGWHGCNPVSRLSDRCGVSVALENDADAAALGEAVHGAGRGKGNLIFVTVGTGIGGGILVNGSLYRGAGGIHPEIGHHTIDASGPLCFCGLNGCWEILARGPAIAQRYAAASARDGAKDVIDARAVCDLARTGDDLALREIRLEAQYLAIGIANLVTLYAPEAIVLGGSVMRSADLFLPTIRRLLDRPGSLVPAEHIELRTATLGDDAPLVGAAVVWRHRFQKAQGS
jgi:glucokinase